MSDPIREALIEARQVLLKHGGYGWTDALKLIETALAALSTTPAPGTIKVRPEWLDTLDDTIRLLNGMGRHGIVARLARLRAALEGAPHDQ